MALRFDHDAARALITRVQSIEKRAASVDLDAIRALMSSAREIDSSERRSRQRLASRFNIFETLNVLDTELVHSSFLAFLLDPRATHDQGTLFLQSFFDRFLGEQSLPTPNVEDTFVYSEFATVHGRLDVMVFLHTRAAICIENKVCDVEQEDQIRRYQHYLASLKQATHRCVVFLSPNGSEPTTADPGSAVPVVAISYSQIAHWLRAISDQLPVVLSSTLGMYATSCIDLSKGAKEPA